MLRFDFSTVPLSLIQDIDVAGKGHSFPPRSSLDRTFCTACLPDVHLLCALPFGLNGRQGAGRRNQFKVKYTKMRQSQY